MHVILGFPLYVFCDLLVSFPSLRTLTGLVVPNVHYICFLILNSWEYLLLYLNWDGSVPYCFYFFILAQLELDLFSTVFGLGLFRLIITS